jgi:hypothetical protein
VATTRRKRQCTTYHRWRTAQDARSETEGGPAYHSKTASNPDERNRTGRLQALPPEHSRLHGTQRTHWLSEEQPPDQDTASMYGRESAPQRREKSARRSMEASAAPVSAPVTADTRRHSAAADDSESGAERHPATVPDTARHRPTPPDTPDWVSKTAGCKFDSCSTCPENPEFIWAAAVLRAAHVACFDPHLTPTPA